MILDLFKEEMFDITFRTRILELVGWDEKESTRIVASFSNCMSNISLDKDQSYDEVKIAIRDNLSKGNIDDYIIDEFIEYLDKMAQSLSESMGADYEN